MTASNSEIHSLVGPILVTGASGFVGANLFKRLASLRKDVYAVVRDKKSWRLLDVNDEYIIATNLNNLSATRALVSWLKPRTIFDCVAYGAYSFEDQVDLIYETNFLAAVNLMEALAREGISAYVHAGSSSEYGTNCSAPSETCPRDPNSHYAVSKSAVADYLMYAGRHRDIPCLNLRLYSVYGPLEDTSRLIPNLLRKALDGTLPPFVAPSTSRDFIHVDDVCDAFVQSALRINPEIYGQSLNIGTGNCTSIADLAYLTKNLFSINEEPQFGTMESRAWDLPNWYADPLQAEKSIGWRSRTSLSDGLLSTATWVKSLTHHDMIALTKMNLKGIE